MSMVDLAPRTAGLIPTWLVPLLALVWVAALWVAWGPLRRRWPGLGADVAGLAALWVLHLLFFWRPLLTPVQIPRGGGDLASFMFPLHAFAAEQVQQGTIPLWNPHLHGGMPHLANFQAALLYPPNLLAYLLARPFSYGTIELLATLHYLVASVGAYALARSLGLRAAAAVVSGIVFPYSGFLVAHLGHYSMLSVAAWLPLLLCLLRLTVLRASWRWASATVPVVFLMTSAGHQQTLLFTLALAAFWWVFWVVLRYGLLPYAPAAVRGGDGTLTVEPDAPAQGRRWLVRPLVGDLLRAGLAVGIGIALAAPALVPSLEMARLSVRSGLSYEQASEFSLEPVALLHLFLPKVFGSNPTDYWGPFSSGEIWSYVGILTLVLAGLALALRQEPVRLFIAGMALIALFYALGPETPLHGWVFRFVPFFDLVRAPARASLFLDLGLALLAGMGLNELLHRTEVPPRVVAVVRIALRVLLVALAGLVLVVLPLFYSIILSGNDLSNRPVIAVNGLNLLVLYLGLNAVFLWAVMRGHLRRAGLAVAAIALVVVDLFGATATFNPSPDDLGAGFRHAEEVTFFQEQLREDRFRIESATLAWHPNLATMVGLDDVGGLYDPMQPRDFDVLRRVAVADRTLPLYDLLNIRYLITDQDAEAPGAKFAPVLHTADGLVIWENREVRPRAWIAYAAEPADHETALAAMRGVDLDPDGPILLDGPVEPLDGAGEGTATIREYTANAVTVAVITDRPGYLVLADLAYPGWTATVDGQETPVRTANGLFRAVWVPAGAQEVVFRFQPPLVRMSAGLALVALLGWGAMLVIGWRVRRPGAPPEEH